MHVLKATRLLAKPVPPVNSAKDPKFSIVVVINEPSNGQYYSNQVAAPVFSRIAFEALRLYNVAPDLASHSAVLTQNVIKKNY